MCKYLGCQRRGPGAQGCQSYNIPTKKGKHLLNSPAVEREAVQGEHRDRNRERSRHQVQGGQKSTQLVANCPLWHK